MATNMYLAGVPIMTIMELTGHKTITSFMKYLKISQQEVADSLKDHPFLKLILRYVSHVSKQNWHFPENTWKHKSELIVAKNITTYGSF